jgi:hypothetical protein
LLVKISAGHFLCRDGETGFSLASYAGNCLVRFQTLHPSTLKGLNMKNKYTGEVTIKIGEKTFTLVYDWTAIALLESELGAEVLRALFDAGPVALSKILSVGMAKHHPEMTPEKVMELSPPIFPARKAIDDALEVSYFGPEGQPEAKAEDMAEGKPTGKKTK